MVMMGIHLTGKLPFRTGEKLLHVILIFDDG